MMVKYLLALLALMSCNPAYANTPDQQTQIDSSLQPVQIDADRPGTGSDAEVVPLHTLNVEVGTDGKEIRFGVLPHVELDKDEDTWGVKYGYVDNDKFKGSIKVSLDNNHQWTVELPMQKSVNHWFYLGTDIIITKDSRTYVGEFNFTPTKHLTITNDVYNDGKFHYGIYAAWIPPKHSDVQFDIGYSEHKVTLGIAIAVNFHKHH